MHKHFQAVIFHHSKIIKRLYNYFYPQNIFNLNVATSAEISSNSAYGKKVSPKEMWGLNTKCFFSKDMSHNMLINVFQKNSSVIK